LTPLVVADAERSFASFSDPALYFFVPSDPPHSVEVLAERFARLEKRRSPDGAEQWLNWLIHETDGATATQMGLVEATILPDRSALIGYFTFKPYWGQGIACAAVGAAIDHLYTDYGIRLFRADVDTRNAGSLRVLEKLGFRIAEFVPQADFFKGARSDEYRLIKVLG
jgi:RimJ/RimL family protein N-acetyltransferase